MIVRSDTFGELVKRVHAVGSALEADGWRERLLCAVFVFDDELGRQVYLTYHFRWGVFSPVALAADGQYRDKEREHLLAAELPAELPVEPHLGTWFPLRGIPL